MAKGLSLEDIRSQIAITTVDSPKGNIDGAKRAYTIYANDQLLDPDAWNDVIIAYRNGGPLRIRDIGKAVSGPEDMKQAAWADGKRGVFLVIFKQPGANVIDTVDKIKAQLPRLIAAIPPAIKIKIISDRTLTIRAAVEDVQFTLLITIMLVVMVIFVFLRSVWATIIPSVTVPLALLGACSLMWVFGYTLDNLSLMALTIAVGFVVDDAIVMLENITRYIEQGEKPLAAAFKGAGEIGFTIVSISISLVAVLIPLLLMGGIIGRLFREFAVTLAMAIFVSLIVSLTLDPDDGLALPARAQRSQARPVLSMERARFRRRCCTRYERGLDLALRWSLTTLCIFFATRGLVGLSLHHHPQGLLSAAGQRLSHRDVGSGAGYFLCRHEAPSGRTRRDRAARSRGRQHRHVHRRRRQRAQYRPPVHHAEAAQRARRRRPADHRAAAAASWKRSRARGCSCRPRRTCGSAAAPRAPSSNTRCRTPIWTSSTNGRRRSWPRCRRCPNCATSRPTSRPRARR